MNRRIPVLAWLSVTSLDAPIVAVTWQQMFATASHAQLGLAARIALFATSWCIYLADRLADSFTLPDGAKMSARQRFAMSHRRAFVGAIASAAGVLALTWMKLERTTLLAGAVIGVIALLYLSVNHFFARVWRAIPLKEIFIGCLFAAGTCTAVPGALVTWAIPFALLCSLNCIAIAIWECDLDREQRRNSIATAFPRVARSAFVVCIALIAFSIFRAPPTVPAMCIGLSAALLAVLNFAGDRIDLDTRTALADLLMLTPIPALFVT